MMHAPKIEHEDCPVNGVQLHAVTAGDPEGALLIFLHGFPDFWWGWRKQISYFAARGYQVLVPDQRGYTSSSKPSPIKAYKLQYLADDVAALIHTRAKKKVFLVGHDWGGAVAWDLSRRYPELLTKLIVLNMPHPQVMRSGFLRWPRQLLKSWYIAFFQLPFLPELCLRMFNYRLLAQSMVRSSRAGTFPQEVLQRYKEAWKTPGALSAMLHWYRAIRYPSPEETQKITVPTLLIWGKKDAFLSHQMAAASLAYCEQGKLVLLNEASHWVQHEEADKVNSLIDEFISSK